MIGVSTAKQAGMTRRLIMSRSIRHLGCGLVGLLGLVVVVSVAAGQASGKSSPRDLADAMARAQAAQQAYSQAQANLRLAAVQIRKKYETAPETVHARAEVDAAAKDVNDIRAAAVASLHADPNYIELQQEIDHVAGALDPDISHIDLADVDRTDLAQAKMEYAARLHHMEEDALDQNPRYKEAMQRLAEASSHWTTIEGQLNTDLRDDPQYKSAQSDLATAQSNLESADADLQSELIKSGEAAEAQRLQHLRELYNSNYANNADYYYDGYPFYGAYTAYPYFGAGAVTSSPYTQAPATTSKPVPSWSPFTQVPSWSPFTPQPASTSPPIPSWSPFPSQPAPKTGH